MSPSTSIVMSRPSRRACWVSIDDSGSAASAASAFSIRRASGRQLCRRRRFRSADPCGDDRGAEHEVVQHQVGTLRLPQPDGGHPRPRPRQRSARLPPPRRSPPPDACQTRLQRRRADSDRGSDHQAALDEEQTRARQAAGPNAAARRSGTPPAPRRAIDDPRIIRTPSGLRQAPTASTWTRRPDRASWFGETGHHAAAAAPVSSDRSS